ncbi:MAG: acylphosphatase [Dehalococcoidia bacterium]
MKPASHKARLSARVYGRVQGVYFRGFVQEHALKHSLVGYVRNHFDGTTVEVQAEGEVKPLEELVELLKQGPPGARVDRLDMGWGAATGEFDGFEIRETPLQAVFQGSILRSNLTEPVILVVV